MVLPNPTADVHIFIDGRDNVSEQYRFGIKFYRNAKLFDDFGVLAYSIIANMEQQEREYEDYLWWERNSPLRGANDEDDEEIDMGPEEPDEYGGD